MTASRPVPARLEDRVTSFARLLGEIHEEELRLLRVAGRSLTEYCVLRILAHDPTVTATQLARRLSLAKSSVSVVIDDLVNEGLVNRAQNRGDRRRVTLRLSRKGKNWVNRFLALKGSLLWEAMAGLTAEQQQMVEQIMRQVAEALIRRRAGPGG